MMCNYAELIQSLLQLIETMGYERQADISAYWQSLLHQKMHDTHQVGTQFF